MSPTTTPVVDVHIGPDDLARALRADVVEGLCAETKILSPKWLYDERGSELFEEITRLDEYEPFRRELAILRRHAPEIASAVRADTLVELGSGTSEKTRLLLDALRAEGCLERFIPFDVSEPTLREAANRVLAEYPGLAVHAVVGDFTHHLSHLPGGGRRLVATIRRPPLEVRIQGEEVVGAAQRVEHLALHLAHAGRVEALRQPRIGAGQQVPADGVGAELADRFGQNLALLE